MHISRLDLTTPVAYCWDLTRVSKVARIQTRLTFWFWFFDSMDRDPVITTENRPRCEKRIYFVFSGYKSNSKNNYSNSFNEPL